MFISPENAQKIASEMKELLGFDINIMDETGKIIASTNPARIGDIHEGAMKIINTGMDKLVVEKAGEFKNSLPGINFPISIDGNVVGVIGVTGEHTDVLTPGNVIKRMTELMLDSLNQKEKQALYDASRSQFVESWIFSDKNDNDELAYHGKILGIDTTVPRTAIVFNIGQSSPGKKEIEDLGEFKTSLILSQIRSRIEKNNSDLCFIINRRITVFTSKTDRSELLAMVDEISEIIDSVSMTNTYVGISSTASSGNKTGESYREAKKACDAARSGKDRRVLFYSTTEPEFISRCIPVEIREDIINSVFKECSDEEKKQFAQTLKCYFDSNGKISDAADTLFIHRNTFQYRLEKISRITGYDIRNIHDSFILQAVSVWLADKT